MQPEKSSFLLRATGRLRVGPDFSSVGGPSSPTERAQIKSCLKEIDITVDRWRWTLTADQHAVVFRLRRKQTPPPKKDFGEFRPTRPMTMETRCSKIILPNYSKKKPAEDTIVPPLWGTRQENACFSRIICSR